MGRGERVSIGNLGCQSRGAPRNTLSNLGFKPPTVAPQQGRDIQSNC
jgi:hypothetical protein